ncbi:MAG: hypothetical protein A2496_23060 [Burkholderiales bacterium RIFOXYC12_FULL_60_6]|nr:MAG: hypothetical protein A2503_01710 [Burkholderiales bacterium RIFOXYD12_FULL_59_19]OGB79016.1 MAG: hypothetical protein A2496_23060 [Burkholderiales bacterium RIFOXYC12_FULL_60_6]
MRVPQSADHEILVNLALRKAEMVFYGTTRTTSTAAICSLSMEIRSLAQTTGAYAFEASASVGVKSGRVIRYSFVEMTWRFVAGLSIRPSEPP